MLFLIAVTREETRCKCCSKSTTGSIPKGTTLYIVYESRAGRQNLVDGEVNETIHRKIYTHTPFYSVIVNYLLYYFFVLQNYFYKSNGLKTQFTCKTLKGGAFL